MPMGNDDAKWAYVSKDLGAVPKNGWDIAYEICQLAWANGHDVWFLWGDGPNMDHKLNHTEQHPVIDFMVHTKAAGDFVRNAIWERRKRHKLRHVIWNHHITSTVVQPGAVRQMADRGDPTANHEDHVHGEWFAGDYVPPEGARPSVDWKTERLDVDGDLGPKTIAKWQFMVGTPVDGVISEPRSELIYWVERYLSDRITVLNADGKLDRKTILALQTYLGAPTTGVMDAVTVKALQRRLNEGRF